VVLSECCLYGLQLRRSKRALVNKMLVCLCTKRR